MEKVLPMRLRYFVVDRAGQLRKVSQAALEGLWSRNRSSNDLGCTLGKDMRIVTVLCDEALLPKACYLLRVTLDGGAVCEQSRLQACEAVLENLADEPQHPEAVYQLAGWPYDWRRQLAIAMDVPIADLPPIGIGGPLLISSLLNLSVRSSLRYFEQVVDE